MNRAGLEALAEARLADAEALLQAERWAGAYYLLGYAVECALKACAARQFHEHEVPDRKIVTSFYTHKFDALLNISGEKAALEARATIDLAFHAAAVADPASGVLPWLKTLW